MPLSVLELKDPLLKLPDVDELLELLSLLEEELEFLLPLEELELLLELPLLKEPLLKPLVDLLTLDFPPLDLKVLLEVLLLELLNPPELLKLLDPFDFASTTVSPWVMLSKIGIVSIRKLEVKKIKVKNKVNIIFLWLFLFIKLTPKKKDYDIILYRKYIIYKLHLSLNYKQISNIYLNR